MKKRISKSANMYIMFGLLALLFISLGYLSMQSNQEGLTMGTEEEEDKPEGFEAGEEEEE